MIGVIGAYETIARMDLPWLLPRISAILTSHHREALTIGVVGIAIATISRLVWISAGQHRRLIELQLPARIADRGTWGRSLGLGSGPIGWTGFDDMIAYTRGLSGVSGGAFFRLEAIKLEGTALSDVSIVSASVRSLVNQERITMHVDGAKGIASPIIRKGTHFILSARFTPQPGITFDEFSKRFSSFRISVETDANSYDVVITPEDTSDMRSRLQQMEWGPIGEASPFQPAA